MQALCWEEKEFAMPLPCNCIILFTQHGQLWPCKYADMIPAHYDMTDLWYDYHLGFAIREDFGLCALIFRAQSIHNSCFTGTVGTQPL